MPGTTGVAQDRAEGVGAADDEPATAMYRRLSPPAAGLGRGHSHSIVPGGLLVMSSTTRLTSRISLIMREAICSSRS